MSSALDRCVTCGESFSYALMRCQNCHHQVCEKCAIRRGGVFCGAHCAHIFYFGDEEEPGVGGSGKEE